MNNSDLDQSTVLVVDDDPGDREFIEESLRANGMTGVIRLCSSGSSAIRYLQGAEIFADRQRYPYPAIVITDLKMPSGDGFSVLEHLKQDPEFAIIPVLVLSNSADEDDVKRAYRMGASSFIRKPVDYAALGEALRVFYQFWRICKIPRVDGLGRQ